MIRNARKLALTTVTAIVLSGLGYAGYYRFVGAGSCPHRDYRVALELSASPLMVPVAGSALAHPGAEPEYRSACEDFDGQGEVSLSFRGGGAQDAVAAEYRRRLADLGYREAPRGPDGILCYDGTTKEGHPVNFSLSQEVPTDGDSTPTYVAALSYALRGQPTGCV
jgi:hypothetical protein